MDQFYSFFETLSTTQRGLVILVCLIVCWILEGSFPLFRFSYRKWKHAGVNFVFLGTSMIINLLFGFAAIGLFEWTRQNNFGLLQWIHLPEWVELILSIMILELIAQYFVHYLLHKYNWMWKLHMIHHSDTHLDATSGTRHHPGDFALRETFAMGAIVILGAPAAHYLFYRMCNVFFTYFTHANIEVPRWLDKPLSYVFITPNAHKFHHHYKRPWTDRNFGNMLSVWDHLFGTFVYGDPKNVQYGLDNLDGKKDEDVVYQLRLPFKTDL